MALEHLQGKRTGRPRGRRTTSPAIRGLRWAAQNVGKEGVIPPSPAAAHFLDLALNQPEKFFAALAALEEAQKGGTEPTTLAEKKPQRFERVFFKNASYTDDFWIWKKEHGR